MSLRSVYTYVSTSRPIIKFIICVVIDFEDVCVDYLLLIFLVTAVKM